jgi:hypothetical protein
MTSSLRQRRRAFVEDEHEFGARDEISDGAAVDLPPRSSMIVAFVPPEGGAPLRLRWAFVVGASVARGAGAGAGC